MNVAEALTIADYNTWATGRMLDAAARLPAEQFTTAPSPGAAGTAPSRRTKRALMNSLRTRDGSHNDPGNCFYRPRRPGGGGQNNRLAAEEGLPSDRSVRPSVRGAH